MPLHMTKIAFGMESLAALKARLESNFSEGEVRLTTRYLPKRVEEIAGGSLYWIHAHMLVGRSPIRGFAENGEGRFWIRLEPRLIAVQPFPKRAHQGWRYLEGADAPPDLEGDVDAAMPASLAGELSKLGLL
jgi:hypothetical protein